MAGLGGVSATLSQTIAFAIANAIVGSFAAECLTTTTRRSAASGAILEELGTEQVVLVPWSVFVIVTSICLAANFALMILRRTLEDTEQRCWSQHAWLLVLFFRFASIDR